MNALGVTGSQRIDPGLADVVSERVESKRILVQSSTGGQPRTRESPRHRCHSVSRGLHTNSEGLPNNEIKQQNNKTM